MGVSLLPDQNIVNLLPKALIHDFKALVGEQLNQVPYPKSDDESWRKFPVHLMNLPELLSSETEEEPVCFSNLPEREELNSVKVMPLLMDLLQKAKLNYFALLTLYHSNSYYFAEIDSISDTSEFFEWKCKFDQSKNAFPVLIVCVKNNTSAKLRESYASASGTDKLHILGSVSYYHLEDSVTFDVLIEEDYDSDLYHFRFVMTKIGRDSLLNMYVFPIGGFRGKTFYMPEVNGNGAGVTLSSATALSNRELSDVEVTVTHLGDYTTSKISYKAIVNDKSHHIFTGNLSIPNSVKKVSAHQESHNLSLSRKARVEANPKLQVFAEDVSCTHGATVGDIDEEQLFYLLSRGLSPLEAKSLLVSAFYEEKIFKIPFPEDVRNAILTKIHQKILGA